MKLKSRMLWTYILVGVIPVFLSLVIFIFVFRTRWEDTLINDLSSIISEIKRNIYEKAERQSFFAYTIANYISAGEGFKSAVEREELTRFINQLSGTSTGRNKVFTRSYLQPEIIEFFHRDKLVQSEFWLEHAFYIEYGTPPEHASYMWEYLSDPVRHRYFTISFPMLRSNTLVMRNSAILFDTDSNEKVGMVVCSYPVNRDFLNGLVNHREGIIAFVKNDNGIVFSDNQFGELNIFDKIAEIELTVERPYALLIIEGYGKYYLARENVYSSVEYVDGKVVRKRIADVGVLYSSATIDKQVSSFRIIGGSILLLILIIVFILAWYSSNVITTPIINLKSMVMDFKHNYNPIPPPNKLDEEIYLLQESFTQMSESIISDFEQASVVQKSILTPESIYGNIDDYEIDVKYLPVNRNISGDYYNVESIGNGIISVLLSDVSGHGTQAALSTMQLHVLNTESLNFHLPHERLEFFDFRFTKDLKSKNYITCFLLHLYKNKIIYSSGGHPEQYLLKIKLRKIIKLQTEGNIIGAFAANNFTSKELAIEKGDIILLFTDGIYEEFNKNKREFGQARLLKFLEKEIKKKLFDLTASKINEKILHRVNTYRKEEPLNDDITMITIKVL